ncbi:aldehyde dehydrogenase family protein [Alloalcanivorax xenomutans]|jgi:acyl-CoA reductase-like NAD-dependent aldehyde dehydrogenase|uniref:Aldehyde dehydrogenase n=1 Tax=Alloalcanivorax xenomutans TaxID=1094342 RepID=A0A9Q3W541_9GAMM|nr:aldehyde dehydrogenase family protein [Alloalcanivorax xenomutans]ERS14652.1 succinate-semialdehyde dehydrogenase [Alcanivorax sp. PN-3]MBA4720772.1 aldehyde dehydrogenase family protein [Alcanivorax sp.]ARB45556.1 succinate-semialdehyde dehydrogenase [Alloalcanivorax xenomutans]MCE7509358.1 aldehyde dehydrogenase family protein [Alloalcanivorax xenomutans]MCE7524957.1 aldehyde dehydrogenase family protein [Alloalcanivorax xenomutans]|tara:strand:- start:442 stop:2016 length:1575 start_codon:yes stop_codon:yes gene_type:complete
MTVVIDTNPATGKAVAELNETDLATLPGRFEKARQAQRIWAAKSFRERAVHIKRMRNYIRDNAEELARVVSESNGKTLVDALATEVLPCALACQWYGRNAEKVLAAKRRPGGSLLFANKRTEIRRLPLGVVGIISPWNYPLSIPFGEIIMGLMAGNAVLLKVAAATPAVGRAIEGIIEAGQLPDGLFQHIVGSGSAVATAFFENGVDKLFFTGSVNAGKVLMAQAAQTLTPLSLELGGNDPMIVLADADLERASNGAAWAGYQNAGQSCGGVERVYVEASVYDDFVELLAKKTRALRHGPGNDKSIPVDIGSLTTAGQKRTVEQHLEDALAKGARIEAQSRPVGDVENGYFLPATLLTRVSDDMLVMREETFGPIIAVTAVANAEEALEKANDSKLALTSSIWTRDNKKGRALAARLESGVTTLNDHLYSHGLSETPWGGWKESGIGRTHGPEGLEEMTHVKAINWDLLPAKRNLWWYPFDRATYKGLLNALYFAFPKGPLQWLGASLKLTPFLVWKMFGKSRD